MKWLSNLLSRLCKVPKDPFYNCALSKNCAHVDGMLCNTRGVQIMPANMFGSMVAAGLMAAAAKETHQEEPSGGSGGNPQQKYDESFNEGSEE